MTLFRPCIDLHNGSVKQIVGGTLRDDDQGLETNFVSDKPSDYYAQRYRDDNLAGGHVIKLGPNNDEAALEALAAFPGGLQIGGGINADNAAKYLDAGASHVIVTSWIFDGPILNQDKLKQLVQRVGKSRLVLDLSCRKDDQGWVVATNRWQTLTDLFVDQKTIAALSEFCDEFLIHAADVEGQCQGIDEALVAALGKWCNISTTYAGGAKSLADLSKVNKLSAGKIDLAIGSALDIFGGSLIKYQDCVEFNQSQS